VQIAGAPPSPTRAGGALRLAPALVLAAGLGLSAAFVASVPDEVFFSGDAGVKLLVTRQLAAGDLATELHLAAPAWIRSLWDRGLYPFQRPFVYRVDGRWIPQYPPWFMAVSAPLYAAMGWRGLYVLPLLALWATWLVLLGLCRGTGAGPAATALALAALVVASPLTAYGGMFWEHTLGVALAFGGLALFAGPGAEAAGPRRALAGGILLGLSAWFRSEHLCLAGLAVAAAWIGPRPAVGPSGRWRFTAGVAATVTALFALNTVLYGGPLGVHARQVLEGFSLAGRVRDAATVLGELLVGLADHFPLAFVAVIAGAIAVAPRLPLRPPEAEGEGGGEGGGPSGLRFFLALSVAYVLLVPAILPGPQLHGEGGKQWGPRFLLVAVPMLCWVGVLAARALWPRAGRAGRLAMAAVLAAGIGWGVYVNVDGGLRFVGGDYRERIAPMLRLVRADRAEVVAVSTDSVAAELVSTMDRKAFVLTPAPEALGYVAATALANGQDRMLFLSNLGEEITGENTFAFRGREGSMRGAVRARFGLYTVNELRLSWRDAPR
jgi:hypothetical protein